MNKLKVGIIGIRGLPANYGAFDQFVDQFVDYSNEKKKNIFFYISSDIKTKKIKITNVKQFYFFRGKSLAILINSFISIIYFYLLGVRTFLFFGYSSVIFFPLLNFLNCRIICNVDGIEWRRRISYPKKLYFKFCEKLLSKVKVNLIYDSVVIAKYYKVKHKLDGKVIFYPSDFEKYNKDFDTFQNRNDKDNFVVTIVMRFLPENNIESIVKAFVNLKKKDILNHRLQIIGRENEYFNKTIRPLIKDNKNISFLGPVYDRKHLFRYWCGSDYYIHGHSVGGTNPTLIEAISLKLPIIAYDCMFNKKILKNTGFFFKTSEDLIKIIEDGTFLQKKTNLDDKFFKRKYINEEYLKLLKSL
jgi:hypothetical protein